VGQVVSSKGWSGSSEHGLRVYKYDYTSQGATDMSNPLAGAEFKIEALQLKPSADDEKAWVVVGATPVTDASGNEVRLTSTDSGYTSIASGLRADTVYRVTETVAPAGHRLSTTALYLVFEGTDKVDYSGVRIVETAVDDDGATVVASTSDLVVNTAETGVFTWYVYNVVAPSHVRPVAPSTGGGGDDGDDGDDDGQPGGGETKPETGSQPGGNGGSQPGGNGGSQPGGNGGNDNDDGNGQPDTDGDGGNDEQPDDDRLSGNGQPDTDGDGDDEQPGDDDRPGNSDQPTSGGDQPDNEVSDIHPSDGEEAGSDGDATDDVARPGETADEESQVNAPAKADVDARPEADASAQPVAGSAASERQSLATTSDAAQPLLPLALGVGGSLLLAAGAFAVRRLRRL
jgi:hypothetical protein